MQSSQFTEQVFYEISRQVLKSFNSDQRRLTATKDFPVTSKAHNLDRRK